jgi:hypothetical protein
MYDFILLFLIIFVLLASLGYINLCQRLMDE